MYQFILEGTSARYIIKLERKERTKETAMLVHEEETLKKQKCATEQPNHIINVINDTLGHRELKGEQ